jgi:hypothetical protein
LPYRKTRAEYSTDNKNYNKEIKNIGGKTIALTEIKNNFLWQIKIKTNEKHSMTK